MVGMLKRQCCRAGCGQGAVATLTYVHRDQTVVLGPLATYAEPHAYDLCEFHAERLTVPRGWEVVRDQPGRRPARIPGLPEVQRGRKPITVPSMPIIGSR